MCQQESARARRLAVWFTLNLVIFILCYLNYRLQLKHRYLYKTLNAGLCFSRAAAMVINFNLLLVWLPMCKYTLTRVAYAANERLKRRRRALEPALRLEAATGRACSGPLETVGRALRVAVERAKTRAISVFIVAVDHSTSLHTICATTITVASVVHTVAHCMNVINFSRNFDPFLSNLNMAEFKGQNPVHLLISVPGITGSLMIIILLLMSLSSIDLIRNSSYDLFQIFHRLSVVFVILLFLHPASHVLKEQSNVERHHPELCQPAAQPRSSANQTSASSPSSGAEMMIDLMTSDSFEQPIAKQQRASAGQRPTGACLDERPQFVAQSSISWYILSAGLSCYILDLVLRKWRRSRASVQLLEVRLDREGNLIELTLSNNHRRFAHWLPGQFVYLNCPQIAAFEWHPFTISSMDNESRRFTLHIKTGGDWTRKLREHFEAVGSRAHPAGRLEVDCLEGTEFGGPLAADPPRGPLVVEDADQLFGRAQTTFDCLRLSGSSKSLSSGISSGDTASSCSRSLAAPLHLLTPQALLSKAPASPHQEAPVRCTKMAFACPADERTLAGQHALAAQQQQHHHHQNQANDHHKTALKSCFINLTKAPSGKHSAGSWQLPTSSCQQSIAITSIDEQRGARRCRRAPGHSLSLYVDGPFHSPFQRLLEKRVAVCLASGVGWTAFSSVFHCVINELERRALGEAAARVWWARWSEFAVARAGSLRGSGRRGRAFRAANTSLEALKRLSESKVHLIIIVTSIEQLRPFYRLAGRYFECIQRVVGEAAAPSASPSSLSPRPPDDLDERPAGPIQEVTAYVTRTSESDDSLREFCQQENLTAYDQLIRVNGVFSIRLGKPKFAEYLSTIGAIYRNEKKVSVYCCGSYQVKRPIRELCQALSGRAGSEAEGRPHGPIYSYHEENF